MKITFSNFQQTLVSIVDVAKIDKIAAAVSGGADSTCLTLLLNKFCKSNTIELVAITIDHKLRKESTQEAKKTSKYMKKCGIRHIILTWEHSTIKNNLQEKARDARYKLLCDYCIKNKIRYLFIAHHYDDQAETVMLRILRGSGIDGVAGIDARSEIYGISIVRPLLNYKKSQIIDFLKAEKATWFDDRSNLNSKFSRVKIRKLLQQLDYNNNLTDRLNLLAKNANRVKNFLYSYTDKIFKKYCVWGNFGHISIKNSNFLALDEEIKLRIINKVIKYIHNDLFIYPTRLNSLKFFLENLQHQKKLTLGKCKIILHKEIIYFYKEPQFVEPAKRLSKGENIWDKRYKININADNFYITRLTKKIWSQVRQKEYIHQTPGEIIFSTPVLLCTGNNQYYWLFSNFSSFQKNSNTKISVTHIPSNSCFEMSI